MLHKPKKIESKTFFTGLSQRFPTGLLVRQILGFPAF
jgi:hypothetical protein